MFSSYQCTDLLAHLSAQFFVVLGLLLELQIVLPHFCMPGHREYRSRLGERDWPLSNSVQTDQMIKLSSADKI